MKVWNLNHWTTKKFPELSSDQPKIRLLDVKDALYEPCANHKTKTYRKCTKEREKRVPSLFNVKTIKHALTTAENCIANLFFIVSITLNCLPYLCA